MQSAMMGSNEPDKNRVPPPPKKPILTQDKTFSEKEDKKSSYQRPKDRDEGEAILVQERRKKASEELDDRVSARNTLRY